MTRTTASFTTLGLFGVLASACAEGSLGPCPHRLCSIDDPACVEQIAETMACQLELDEVVQPTVRFLTSDEVVAEIRADTEDRTPEQIRDITDYFRAESLVGLMPTDYEYGDQDTNFVDWAIAYYSPLTKEVTIITDNIGDDAKRSYLVMVHEMVHVYQDAERDLTALTDEHGTTFDRFLGLRALIEGEAEIYESLADIQFLGFDPDDVDWPRYFRDYQAFALDAAAESEAPSLDAIAYFPYAFGSEFYYEAWKEARTQPDRGATEALFSAPPDSVRQVMAGYRLAHEVVNGDDRLAPHAAPVLPERYEYLGGGHQSVWLLNAMLQRTAGHMAPWASLELAGVSADHLSIFRDEESGALVALWRIQDDGGNSLSDTLVSQASTRWVDGTDGAGDPAAEPTTHLVVQVDGDLLLVASNGPDARQVLGQIEGWQTVETLRAQSERSAAGIAGMRIFAQGR
ncbi:MAG: hypothetical protein AAGF11_24880 [Myxococcota bacterium]